MNPLADLGYLGHTLTVEHLRGVGHLPRCSCGWVGQASRKRVSAERQAKTAHLKRRTVTAVQCPTPGKRRFRTEAKAAAEIGSFWQTGRGTVMPIRTYLCPCGYWHNTKRDRWAE